MGSLISLFGPDGSGKTTIARKIATYLRAHGVDVAVVWMRGTHTLASILAKFLARFQAFQGPCNPYYRICIPSKMKRLWTWIEFASILPIILTRFAFPKLLWRVVIAERSFIDFLVWLIITLRNHDVAKSFCWKAALSLASSLSDEMLYIRADPEVLAARRKGSREGYLIPLQLQIYDTLAEILKAPCIDTSRKPVDETLKEALKKIGAA